MMSVKLTLASLLTISCFSSCGTSNKASVYGETITRTWKQDLKSEQNTIISVEGESLFENRSSNKPLYVSELSRMIVTLTGESQTIKSARMVLINTVRNEGLCGSTPYNEEFQYELDLVPMGSGQFSAELLESGTVLWGFGSARKMVPASIQKPVMVYDSSSTCKKVVSLGMQVAFVIDGEWQRDPITQSNNFNLQTVLP